MINEIFENYRGDGRFGFNELADGLRHQMRFIFKKWYAEKHRIYIESILLKDTIIKREEVFDGVLFNIKLPNLQPIQVKEKIGLTGMQLIFHLNNAILMREHGYIDDAWEEIIELSFVLSSIIIAVNKIKGADEEPKEEQVLNILSQHNLKYESLKTIIAKQEISKQNSKAPAGRNKDIHEWIYSEYEANLSLEKPLLKKDFGKLYESKVPLKFNKRVFSAKRIIELLCKKYPKGYVLAK